MCRNKNHLIKMTNNSSNRNCIMYWIYSFCMQSKWVNGCYKWWVHETHISRQLIYLYYHMVGMFEFLLFCSAHGSDGKSTQFLCSIKNDCDRVCKHKYGLTCSIYEYSLQNQTDRVERFRIGKECVFACATISNTIQYCIIHKNT